jgi:hypothetical protein
VKPIATVQSDSACDAASLGLDHRGLPSSYRPATICDSRRIDPLPPYVEAEFETLRARIGKDIEILRAMLVTDVATEFLLQDVAYRCGLSFSEINPALCRICDAWIEMAPKRDITERRPILHVIGRLIDRWVPHRNSRLSPDQRRAVQLNKLLREEFVKSDVTAKVFFDSITRLCAPAILAGGALARRKVERAGLVTLIGQDAFKVFFDTLFVFDPEKADASKSTEDQFFPYLRRRYEYLWRDNCRQRCEDQAIRSIRGRKGEVGDMVSLVEDSREESPEARIETHDQFEWILAALARARDEGVVRSDDYEAILEYFGLNGAENGVSDKLYKPSETRQRASRGIKKFKPFLIRKFNRYLRES